MKIINFSNVAVQPFWSAPVQALAPWISRLRNSLANTADSSAALSNRKPVRTTSKAACTQTASNDSIFDLGPQASVDLVNSAKHCNPRLSTRSNITLRIVREADSGIRPDCAGRMVISGRMADVCAELDRMALRAASGASES